MMLERARKNHLRLPTHQEHDGSFSPRKLFHRPTRKPKRFPILVATVIGCFILAGLMVCKNEGILFQGQHAERKAGLSLSKEEDGVFPIIEEGDEEDPEEGQKLIIDNVNKVRVDLRAIRGESTLFLGKTGEEKVVLHQGDKRVIEGDDLYFRLGCPSSVDILINDKLVTTRAQDQEKSYHVLRKLS